MNSEKTGKTLTKKYLNHVGGDRVVAVMAVIFMAVYYILPQYFGFDTAFFDLTAQRIFIIIFFIYLFEKKNGMKEYAASFSTASGGVFLALYLFVLLYTAIARKHVGTILYSLIEVLALFLVVFAIKHCLGVKRFVKLISFFIGFLCVLGMVEYLMKSTPFAHLKTISGLYCGAYIRAGSYRIMGPANHALGYGLMLVTMTPFAVLDTEKDKISFGAHPVVLALLTINIFLTGSRSTLGIYIMELGIVFLLCSFEEKKKALIAGVCVLAVLVPVVVATSSTSFSRYILRTFMSVIDQVFGTSFAVRFGADARQLANSSVYREQLKLLYKVKWLNPLLGQGSQYQVYWKVNGFTIESIDNAYLAMYIRYGYPGMITYILFILTVGAGMLIQGIKRRSGLCFALFVGFAGYFMNLRYVDTLQTIKYAYILFALFFACYNKKTGKFTSYLEAEKSNGDVGQPVVESTGTTVAQEKKVSYIKRR